MASQHRLVVDRWLDDAQGLSGIKSMRTTQPIRKKLLLAMLVLACAIIVLAYSGVRGVFAYRDLAATVSNRAAELPTTAELTQAVDELRFAIVQRRNELVDHHRVAPVFADLHDEFRHLHSPLLSDTEAHSLRQDSIDDSIQHHLLRVRAILDRYQEQLQSSDANDRFLADRSREQDMVSDISCLLDEIEAKQTLTEILDPLSALVQSQKLKEFHQLVHALPTFLQSRMASFRVEVRSQYRTWIILTISSTTFATCLIIGVLIYTRRVVINPFKQLLLGARKVAGGDFDHRIVMQNQDELAELASAINTATAEFRTIQRDLHDQVRERSREVIRNEQLASVGFLAAGVAHEINNPLASIAWSAEALESRLHRILHPSDETADPAAAAPDVETLRSYLRRIQDEAFRCKGITERLLDFSRLGQAERKQTVDVADLVEDVIAMVRHLGQYRNHKVVFERHGDTHAWASPQEMKQVVLNLLTNALDSLSPEQADGQVTITMDGDPHWLRLSIDDNGCGMTDEVLEHLFEPFFTRRRDGRGTGLGLPITSRIIADHGGRIQPSSRGPNLGSRFEIQIPRQQASHEHESHFSNAIAA
jgi:two-component system NtrC family sensor kinase